MAFPFMPDVEAMVMMSPSCCAFIPGTTRLVMSTMPNTFVSNIARIASRFTAPISAR